MPKFFVGEPFSVSIISRIEKVWIRGGEGVSRFCVEKILSHSAEKFRKGNLYCCNNFGYRKSLDKSGGVSRFSVEVFVSLYRNISLKNTLVFQKNFAYRKFSCIGGVSSRFCRNFSSHRTEAKNFVKEPSCFSDFFWYWKNLWIRGGISRFSVEIFMSHSAENFRKGILPFFRKFLVSESFMNEKKGYHLFPLKIFGLTVPNIFVGIPSIFEKYWGNEKLYA